LVWGSEKLETRNDDVQPLWQPAQPQPVQRDLILPHLFCLFAAQAMWNSAKVLDISCFGCASGTGRLKKQESWKPPSRLFELEPLNFEPPQGFDRSEAIERLERDSYLVSATRGGWNDWNATWNHS